MVNNELDVIPIYNEIKNLIVASRKKVYSTVNVEMLNLYWNIGKIIMGIQNGKTRAKYGDYVLSELSVKLTKEFGKGFSIINLRRMRKFYLCFPIRSSVMNGLSWTHYLEIIKIDDPNKRNFYIQETINSKWNVRELQRQKDSLLYERLITSKTNRNYQLKDKL